MRLCKLRYDRLEGRISNELNCVQTQCSALLAPRLSTILQDEIERRAKKWTLPPDVVLNKGTVLNVFYELVLTVGTSAGH